MVGDGTPAEMMEGFDDPQEAIGSYCEDWPWAGNPDEEQEDLMGYTPRQLLVIYLENHKNEWS